MKYVPEILVKHPWSKGGSKGMFESDGGFVSEN